MKTLNLIQGSDEWLEARLNHLTASEAPAMMGESKFMSRNQLLDLKKGWQSNPNSSFKEKLFQKGHVHEDSAREILELDFFDEYPAAVGLIKIDGLSLLASFDGLAGDSRCYKPWEHKSWNLTLAENVRNGVLEPLYYWQLEHQMLVAGSDSVLFTCSDGGSANRVSTMYHSVPERREKLISGWKQFLVDLEAHEIEAKKEVVVAQEQKSFPVIECKVEGSTVVSNLGSFIPVIKAAIDEKLSVVLETDQDFADTEAFVKNIKSTRVKLKQEQVDITNAFESYSAFVNDVAVTDSILQKAESKLNSAVKSHKEAKKLSIKNNGQIQLNEHLGELSEGINGVQITQVVVEWDAVIKGKRSFEKMEEAVDAELAKAKIEANDIAQLIRKNLDSLTELAKDHRFLFSDHALLLLKDNDDLVNLIKARIAEHEAAESERKRQEQDRIEREAKEKAEREAKAKLEAEREQIRKEEQAKAKAENDEKATNFQEDMKQGQAKTNESISELVKEKPVKERLAERFSDRTTSPEEERTPVRILLDELLSFELTPEKLDQVERELINSGLMK